MIQVTNFLSCVTAHCYCMLQSPGIFQGGFIINLLKTSPEYTQAGVYGKCVL